MQRKALILGLVLYLLSAVGTYAGLNLVGTEVSLIPGPVSETPQQEEEESPLAALLDIPAGEPKDQACPLNGKLYTNTERQAWEQRRPLAVMVENSPDARPQSGLGDADVIFEAVAEGGVTRFMALFYCAAQAYDITIAPVRSARVYFLELADSFNEPMYVHVGGANLDGPTDALQMIKDWGWELENDINQFSVGYPTFVRDYNRIPGKEIATEHTMVTTSEALWEVATDRDWTNLSPQRTYGRRVVEPSDWKDGFTPWKFAPAGGSDGNVTDISYDFWTGYNQFAVNWKYDPATNTYKRFMGGEPHVDLNTDKQIEASTVIVYLTRERGPLNEKKHMLYDIIGTGDVLIFKNGTVEKGTWIKKTRDSAIELKVDGEDAELAPGLVWVSVVSTATDVEY